MNLSDLLTFDLELLFRDSVSEEILGKYLPWNHMTVLNTMHDLGYGHTSNLLTDHSKFNVKFTKLFNNEMQMPSAEDVSFDRAVLLAALRTLKIGN